MNSGGSEKNLSELLKAYLTCSLICKHCSSTDLWSISPTCQCTAFLHGNSMALNFFISNLNPEIQLCNIGYNFCASCVYQVQLCQILCTIKIVKNEYLKAARKCCWNWHLMWCANSSPCFITLIEVNYFDSQNLQKLSFFSWKEWDIAPSGHKCSISG